MANVLPISEGADAFVELLNSNGVDHIFLNPGTDIAPIQEAVAKFKSGGRRAPRVVLCLHESVAMSAAIGHFMVSGRPQVVLVHGDVGTQQVGGSLHNAQRGRAAVVFCAGRTPSIPAEIRRGGRTHRREWLQDTFDQSGIVRSYVKWDYMLRTSENMAEVVQRAFQVAETEPCGPVYLTLPREALMEKMDGPVPSAQRYQPPSTPQADVQKLAEAAGWLLHAQRPVIITGYSGRNPGSVASLIELAELLGAPVLTSELLVNFPLRHSLCAGVVSSKGLDNPGYLKDADVVLIIDHDVPYVPSPRKDVTKARIICIDIDPVKQDMPLWGFPTDILLHADSAKAILALNDLIRAGLRPELKKVFRERSRRIAAENDKVRASWHDLAVSKAGERPVSGEWLSHCIDQVVGEEDIVVSEIATEGASLARQLRRSQPKTLFANAGSSLGWGLGASLGAKLAAPDKTVVGLISDGAFVFGCPVAALWAAVKNGAPFLTVVFNNQRYNAPMVAIRNLYGKDCSCAATGDWSGCEITPPPDYAGIARACGACGETVTEPGGILQALRNGLERVRAGQAALVDVRIA